MFDVRCSFSVWLVALFVLFLGSVLSARAADTPQSKRSFETAKEFFYFGQWDRADRDFGEFVENFPASDQLAEALLLQAQSRFRMSNYGGVIELLTDRLKGAGAQEDQFRYWIAEAEFYRKRFAAAVDHYAQVVDKFPNSNRRLAASYGQALAHFEMGDFARATQLLKDPQGAFLQTAQGNPEHELVMRGHLLLAKALHGQTNYAAATETLNQLGARALKPEVEWERQYVLAIIERAKGQLDAALQLTTNLVTLAITATNATLQAKAIKLQAEVFLDQNQPDAAIEACDRIVRIKDVPPTEARDAIFKSVDLRIRQGRLADAAQQLDQYFKNTPMDPAQDLLRVTLGELHLKQYYQTRGTTNPPAITPALTNFLVQAHAQFDLVINQFTNSPHVGKALLNRGWVFWEEAQTSGAEVKFSESLAAFQAATNRLTNSEDQATAYFKSGDCQFRLENYTNALLQFRTVLATYENSSEVKKKLFDQTLYQILRACIEVNDLAGMGAVLDRMLKEFSTSPLADESLYLAGKARLKAGHLTEARGAFAELQRRFPGSSWRAASDLGLAQAYDLEGEWAGAIREYSQWSQIHTNHPARAEVEYSLGLVYWKSGQDTNAFGILTNLVENFPTSRWAPRAEFWVGGYFFGQQKYRDAAEHYRNQIFQNTNVTSLELGYRARYMEARSAHRAQLYNDARSKIAKLIEEAGGNSNAPMDEAYFLFGEIEKDERNYVNAIRAFGLVKGWLEPRALGHMGDCHLQLAATNSAAYKDATNAYQQVLDSPLADIATRNQAEYGIAQVLEKLAEDATRSEMEKGVLLKRALEHYLDILSGKRLRVEQGELPNYPWVNRAGFTAGNLAAEKLGRLQDALNIYQQLKNKLPPPLHEAVDKKIEDLKQRLARRPTG